VPFGDRRSHEQYFDQPTITVAHLTHPEQKDLSYLSRTWDRRSPPPIRKSSGYQGLAAAQTFSGRAVRSVYARARAAGTDPRGAGRSLDRTLPQIVGLKVSGIRLGHAERVEIGDKHVSSSFRFVLILLADRTTARSALTSKPCLWPRIPRRRSAASAAFSSSSRSDVERNGTKLVFGCVLELHGPNL